MALELEIEVGDSARRLSTLAEILDPNPEVEGFHLTWVRWSPYRIIVEQKAVTTTGRIRSPWGGPGGIMRKSNEKAFRLLAHHIIDPSAVSSWQSRDPEQHKYQGAVLFPRESIKDFDIDIFSVSAYKEPMDEAVALMIGRQMGHSESVAAHIAYLSGNEFYFSLRDAFYGR